MLFEPFHGEVAIRKRHAVRYDNPAWSACDPKQTFLEWVYKEFANENRVVGFKSLFNHHSTWELENFVDTHDLVLVGRRPLLKIITSLALALTTGHWLKRDMHMDRFTRIDLGDADLAERLHREVELIHSHYGVIDALGLPVVPFGIDDIPHDALKKHGILLGPSKFQKVRNKEPEDCIENLDELRDFIARCQKGLE